MSKTVKRLLILGIIAAVAAAVLVPRLISSDGPGPARGGPGGARGPRNDTLKVAAHIVRPDRLINGVVTTGAIRANESVELASEASGRLVRIYFQEGRAVPRGQIIVKINDADLQAQRARTLHRLNLAERRERRQSQILEQGGISQEEYDMAQSELNVLRSEIEVIDAQIAKTEIRAPFSGVIGLRYVSEGAYVSPQTRIATLHNLNPIKIDFSLPEKYANEVRVGGKIQFRVEGSDQLRQATIYAIEPRIAANTRTLQLRATAPNPGGRLMPGGFANVELILEEIPEALTVPAISIIPELNTKKVYVYRSGKAEPREIETGIRTESAVQVTGGLAPGDTVLTSGIQLLRPGAPVQILSFGAPDPNSAGPDSAGAARATVAARP